MQKIFHALSSEARRQILAHLASGELKAGDISGRFNISKPAISIHLTILENAGLVTFDKRANFHYYRLVPGVLSDALLAYVKLVEPHATVAG
jgi:DNA-binding transcriptional ArsR family regulator